MPKIGTDEQGSDAAFDWMVTLKYETKKLLEGVIEVDQKIL